MSAAPDFWGLCECCLRDASTEQLVRAESLIYDALVSAQRRGVAATIEEAIAAVAELGGGLSDWELEAIADRVILASSRELGPALAARAHPAIRKAVWLAYKHTRFSLPGFSTADAAAAWNTTDRRAMQWLDRDNLFWVLGHDQRTWVVGEERVTIGEVIAREAIRGAQEGEHATEVGRRIRARLKATVGKQTDSYWRGLAANAATRSAAFGTVASFEVAGVTVYEYVNPLDERTSDVCRELNGMTFPVHYAVTQRNQMMGAQSPEDVKTISPWLKGADVKALKAQGTEALAAAGVILPPRHFHCRSVIVVAESGFSTSDPAPEPVLAAAAPNQEAQDAFVGAFDPTARGLRDGSWSRRGVEGVHLGEWIGADGLAHGTEYREPWLRGLRMSTWPTSLPMDDGTYWLPAPHPDGGRWVELEKRLPGAIQGGRFKEWREKALEAA